MEPARLLRLFVRVCVASAVVAVLAAATPAPGTTTYIARLPLGHGAVRLTVGGPDQVYVNAKDLTPGRWAVSLREGCAAQNGVIAVLGDLDVPQSGDTSRTFSIGPDVAARAAPGAIVIRSGAGFYCAPWSFEGGERPPSAAPTVASAPPSFARATPAARSAAPVALPVATPPNQLGIPAPVMIGALVVGAALLVRWLIRSPSALVPVPTRFDAPPEVAASHGSAFASGPAVAPPRASLPLGFTHARARMWRRRLSEWGLWEWPSKRDTSPAARRVRERVEDALRAAGLATDPDDEQDAWILFQRVTKGGWGFREVSIGGERFSGTTFVIFSSSLIAFVLPLGPARWWAYSDMVAAEEDRGAFLFTMKNGDVVRLQPQSKGAGLLDKVMLFSSNPADKLIASGNIKDARAREQEYAEEFFKFWEEVLDIARSSE